jgi:hypothetical protein
MATAKEHIAEIIKRQPETRRTYRITYTRLRANLWNKRTSKPRMASTHMIPSSIQSLTSGHNNSRVRKEIMSLAPMFMGQRPDDGHSPISFYFVIDGGIALASPPSAEPWQKTFEAKAAAASISTSFPLASSFLSLRFAVRIVGYDAILTRHSGSGSLSRCE